MASNIKSVWLRSTFWLGSRYPLSPDLFWLVHCAFHQNHSNRYTVFCPRVLNCQTSATLRPRGLYIVHNINFALNDDWWQTGIPNITDSDIHCDLGLNAPHSPSPVDANLDKWVSNHIVHPVGSEQYTIYLTYYIGVWWRSTEQFRMTTLWLFGGWLRPYNIAYLWGIIEMQSLSLQL